MATLVPAGFGSAFTQRATPENSYRAVCWSPDLSLFVAVSAAGGLTAPVMTSPDGITWTARSAGTANHYWYDVIWVEELGLFVAVGGDSLEAANVMTSPDGLAWTLRTLADESWISVAWNGTTLVAVSAAGTNVATSTDGVTWAIQSTTGITYSSLWEIAWDATNARFIAISTSTVASEQVFTSTDGIAWTARTGRAANEPTGVAVSPSGVSIIPLTNTSDGLLRSTDGVTWALVTFTGQGPILGAGARVHAIGATGFLLIGGNENYAISNDGGVTWSTGSVAAISFDYQSAAYAESLGLVAAVAQGFDTDDVAATIAYSALPAVTGLDHLEGESVAVVADDIVLASPLNPAYDEIVVSGGRIDLPAGSYTSVWVGLPIVSDLRTLDIDTAGSRTLKEGRFAITRLGLWVEETRTLWAGQREPSTDALTDGTYYLQPLPLEDEEGNPTSDAITGYRQVNVEGTFTRGGSIFLRNVDPRPVAILAVVPQGHFPSGAG